MNTKDIIRVWKDRKFRDALDGEQRPVHPAGAIELDEWMLERVAGATGGISNNGCTCGTTPGMGGTPGRPCEF